MDRNILNQGCPANLLQPMGGGSCLQTCKMRAQGLARQCVPVWFLFERADTV